MIQAIPGGRGLFSLLQYGLKHKDRHRIRIDKHMRAHLTDFEALAADLHDRPTHLAELVPEEPTALGSHDASGQGYGGSGSWPIKHRWYGGHSYRHRCRNAWFHGRILMAPSPTATWSLPAPLGTKTSSHMIVISGMPPSVF